MCAHEYTATYVSRQLYSIKNPAKAGFIFALILIVPAGVLASLLVAVGAVHLVAVAAGVAGLVADVCFAAFAAVGAVYLAAVVAGVAGLVVAVVLVAVLPAVAAVGAVHLVAVVAAAGVADLVFAVPRSFAALPFALAHTLLRYRCPGLFAFPFTHLNNR